MQLIMEYVPLGSLRDYLPKHNVSLAHILLFAQQICEVTTGPKPGSAWGTVLILPLPRREGAMLCVCRSRAGVGAGETNDCAVQCPGEGVGSSG